MGYFKYRSFDFFRCTIIEDHFQVFHVQKVFHNLSHFEKESGLIFNENQFGYFPHRFSEPLVELSDLTVELLEFFLVRGDLLIEGFYLFVLGFQFFVCFFQLKGSSLNFSSQQIDERQGNAKRYHESCSSIKDHPQEPQGCHEDKRYVVSDDIILFSLRNTVQSRIYER